MEVVFGQWGGGRSHILWSLDESPVIYTVNAVGLYASSQCMLAMVSSSPFPKSCMTSLEISKIGERCKYIQSKRNPARKPPARLQNLYENRHRSYDSGGNLQQKRRSLTKARRSAYRDGLIHKRRPTTQIDQLRRLAIHCADRLTPVRRRRVKDPHRLLQTARAREHAPAR